MTKVISFVRPFCYTHTGCIQKTPCTYIKNVDTYSYYTTAVTTFNKLILTHLPHAHLYVFTELGNRSLKCSAYTYIK